MTSTPQAAGGSGRLTWAWRPDHAAGVVVLVHGVQSDSRHAWGPGQHGPGALAAVTAANPPFAVACYDYPSVLTARDERTLLPLHALAVDLDEVLDDQLLPSFERVAVVAYCLGALVARFALRSILTRTAAADLRGRVGLHLLDGPETWPQQPVERGVSRVLELLEVDAPTLQRGARWWSDRAGPAGLVDEWALVCSQPSWTTPFRPGSTSPRSRVHRTDVQHLDLTRPAIGQPHPLPDHVLGRVRRQLSAATPA